MKLFSVKHVHTRTILPEHFPSKPAAKKYRDELNLFAPGTYVVTPGPDHRKTQGK
jgi:hypothetical protein